jgi:oligopeptide transport system substrate-binding protein
MSLTRRRFLQASTLAAAGATCAATRGTAAAAGVAQSGGLVTPAVFAAQSTPTASYGGTLIATIGSDMQTFDPAISYEWTNWSTLPNVFEGLIGFKPQSTDLVPLLAADMPTVSEDGLVYTVKLRQGVKFQAPVSREVTSDDFRYSWLRVLNPETASPGVTFLFDIAGAQDYFEGKAQDVSGIKVVDPYTLQIQLAKPTAHFKYILGMTFTMVVPHEIADQYPKDFSHHAVGTGPFMLKDWVQDQSVEFVRNPDYWQEGLPYLDGVTFKVVNQPTVAVQQVQRGEADVFTDPDFPPLSYSQLQSDPTWSKQLVTLPTLRTAYLWMNTSVSPLDNKQVRQAIAMSIDKEKIIKVATGGLAQPTGVVFPPGLPCYDANQPTWPFDPARAKELLAQAGYPDGLSTTIVASQTAVSQATVEQVIQSNLKDIGIQADIQLATGSTYTTLLRSQANQLGQTSWGADYPDPSDFINPLLTGAAVGPSGSNFAWYNNPQVNDLAAQADTTLDESARCALYHQIEGIVIDDAPWLPLYTVTFVSLISPRVTQFWLNPTYAAFDFAYYQVSQ